MDYIDVKTIRCLSPRLNLFTECGNDVYNFRCPFCGDSKKNSNKCRGYIFVEPKYRNVKYKCHNCGMNTSLSEFIRLLDQSLYDEYRLEKFGTKNQFAKKNNVDDGLFKTNTNEKLSTLVDNNANDIYLLDCIPLSVESEGREYMLNRKIPFDDKELYYIDDINKVVSRIEKYKDKVYKPTSAICIPYRTVDGLLTHIQFRILNCGDWRYLTLEVEPNHEKIYGLDDINFNERVYVFEGAFDAMCVTNSIAIGSGSLSSHVEYLKSICNDFVLVFDVDYNSNPDINKYLMKAIEKGSKVVIYDDLPKKYKCKDVNDLIKECVVTDIKNYLDKNTYKGIHAKLKLSQLSGLNRTSTFNRGFLI